MTNPTRRQPSEPTPPNMGTTTLVYSVIAVLVSNDSLDPAMTTTCVTAIALFYIFMERLPSVTRALKTLLTPSKPKSRKPGARRTKR